MAEQKNIQSGSAEAEVESSGFFARFFSGDKPLWAIIILLAIFSLLVVYSSTASMAYKNAGGNTAHYFFNQLFFILLGFTFMWGIHKINYQRLVPFYKLLFWFALVCLALTFVIGVNLNSASRWLRIPILGITFQPSDFVRVTLVGVLAQQLAKRQKVIDKIPILPALTLGGWRKDPHKNMEILLNTTLPLLGPVVLACGAIFFSNFSTAALTFVTCCVMLFIGRMRLKELFRLVSLVVVCVVAAIAVMYMFNIGRSHTWVNRLGLGDALSGTEQVQIQSEEDNLQKEQALIAIASGGIAGKGPGNSTQRSNLPHAYSDFAYAFIVEEYGLIGSCVILFLYLCIFFRGIVIFQRCATALPSLLVLGLSLMITLQALINMLVSVGFFPVTGQTLPLISLGGSSVVFTSMSLGIILGVSRQMKEQSLDQPKNESLLE